MAHHGTYIVKCVKPGGLTLEKHGGFAFAEGQEIDLLLESTDERIRAWPSWSTAHRMCVDGGLEFAQAIANGDLEIVNMSRPKNRGGDQ